VVADPDLSPGIAARLAAAVDYIGRARQVVAVRTDLLLPGDLTLRREIADPVAFETLAHELALGSAATRLADAMRTR
jgi:hypothetical protein